jgi:hypothetical protein
MLGEDGMGAAGWAGMGCPAGWPSPIGAVFCCVERGGFMPGTKPICRLAVL